MISHVCRSIKSYFFMAALAFRVSAVYFAATVLWCGTVQAASAVSAGASAVLPLPALEHHVAGLTDREVPPQPVPVAPVPVGGPHVVVVLLDDVGFGAAGTFGGPVPTPTLDRLAAVGLRYNAFHTTAICSPTRASLLTGRNPHSVGMGNVTNAAAPYEGRNGVMPKSAATIAEILRQNGYSTSAWGKWHLIPHWELSQAGSFDHWPTRMGFKKFYGFLGAETHQFEPNLYEGTSQVTRPNRKAYHLTEELPTVPSPGCSSRNPSHRKSLFSSISHRAPHMPLCMHPNPGLTAIKGSLIRAGTKCERKFSHARSGLE